MDTFMFAALRVACAQLVRAAGYDNASRNAINTLTDVVANCLCSLRNLFHCTHTCTHIKEETQQSHSETPTVAHTHADIQQAGERARQFAEMAQRTESNEYDVLSALRTMGVSARALTLYARHADDVPFAQRLPTAAERRAQLAGVREQLLAQLAVVTPHRWEGARPPHVPAFLPPFPKAHTYCATLARVDPVPLSARLRRFAKQQQSVESTLVAIYARSGRRAPHTDYATAMSVSPPPARRRAGSAGGAAGGAGVGAAGSSAAGTGPVRRTSTAALFAAAAANTAAEAEAAAAAAGGAEGATASLMTREGAPEAVRQEIEAKMKRFDTRRDVSDSEDDRPPVVPVVPVAPAPAPATPVPAGDPAAAAAAVAAPGAATPVPAGVVNTAAGALVAAAPVGAPVAAGDVLAAPVGVGGTVPLPLPLPLAPPGGVAAGPLAPGTPLPPGLGTQ